MSTLYAPCELVACWQVVAGLMLLCRQKQVVCDGAGDCAGHPQAAVYACCCDKCLSPCDYVLNCWLGGAIAAVWCGGVQGQYTATSVCAVMLSARRRWSWTAAGHQDTRSSSEASC